MKPQPPVTPAAWLNQMATDAGHQHVKRIEELAGVLQEQATSPELAAVASQLERLSAALLRAQCNAASHIHAQAKTRSLAVLSQQQAPCA